MVKGTYTPLDILEVVLKQWKYEHKRHNDEIYALLSGHCGNYNLIATWNIDDGILYCSCEMSAKFKEQELKDISNLVFMMNERLWSGHFDVSLKDMEVTFTISNLIQTDQPCSEVLENMIATVVTECDRFYPAFQAVLGDQLSPQIAIDSSLIDTAGEA